jgi:hypothetical protein
MKVTFTPRTLALITAPLAFGLLGACGGGGGGGFSGGIADGGIRGTGSSVGPVSGFGSVFVNGIRFETDGDVVSNDGITSESQLDKGMILRIDGEWREDGQGTADRVEYDDTFRGVVANEMDVVDADNVVVGKTFTIYGQTISTDKLTVFKGTTLENLTNGDFVRVSAWRRGDGSYRASYVGVIAADEDNVEIEGPVTGYDPALNRFRINGFLVQYADPGTDFADGLAPSDLSSESLRVGVEGRVIMIDEEMAIQASSIEEDETRRYRQGSDDDIAFVGPVATAYNGASRTFTINGLTVFVPSNDVFDDGLTTADLTPGLLIQVEGDFRNDGTVEAEEIELREGDAAVLGSFDANTINFSNETFRLGGVLVQVTPLTIITDDDDDNGNRIDFEDLNGNFELEVEGIERTRQDGEVFLEAVRIERDGDEGDGELEMVGRLNAIDDNSVTVLGVQMTAGIGAFEDDDDELSRADLEALFLAGERPLLEVDYRRTSVGLYPFEAQEIELEEEN